MRDKRGLLRYRSFISGRKEAVIVMFRQNRVLLFFGTRLVTGLSRQSLCNQKDSDKYKRIGTLGKMERGEATLPT